jgi:hypothetical protein
MQQHPFFDQILPLYEKNLDRDRGNQGIYARQVVAKNRFSLTVMSGEIDDRFPT